MNDERRPDIDWLRIGATYLLFVFHSAKVFDPAPFFHIRNAEVSFVFTVFTQFVHLWHMPLFFLLAGWSAAASLRARGTGGFARERVRRLAVPLLAGCVLFGPIMKYAELKSGFDMNHRTLMVAERYQDEIRMLIPRGLDVAPPFEETFAEFLPTFFTDLDRFTWGHLWFVAYLLTLTTALLPVMRALLAGSGKIERTAPWMIYSPLALLSFIQLALRPYWPGIYNLYDDWANVCYFATFVLAGFALATQPALEREVERRWRLSLAVAGAATLMLLGGLVGLFQSPPAMLIGSGVAAWCYVLAFVGLGRRTLQQTGAALTYLSESAFPVYVLHQVAIIVIGYWLVELPLGIAVKFVALVGSSLAVTMAIYHFAVRPLALPRMLLGMKPLPPAPPLAGAAMSKAVSR